MRALGERGRSRLRQELPLVGHGRSGARWTSGAGVQGFGQGTLGGRCRSHEAPVGVAFNWARTPISGTRDEYHIEVFYRFPLFPEVDTTFSYQSVWDPAFGVGVDHAHVLSVRLRTTF